MWINDAGYTVKIQKESPKIDGKRVRVLLWHCPFHKCWASMRSRVCDHKVKERRSGYVEATVCEEWKTFSNFKKWMETQPYQGMVLDKDILIFGNKMYSPYTCAFIPNRVNCMFGLSTTIRGDCPIGVTYHANYINKYSAHLKVNNKVKWLGCYPTKEQAHTSWQIAKVGAIDEALFWWENTEEVVHSFNEQLKQAVLRRKYLLLDDITNKRETITL